MELLRCQPVVMNEKTTPDDDTTEKAASWMSGKWGIAWRNRPGDIRGEITNFDVNKLVEEIQGIPGVGKQVIIYLNLVSSPLF